MNTRLYTVSRMRDSVRPALRPRRVSTSSPRHHHIIIASSPRHSSSPLHHVTRHAWYTRDSCGLRQRAVDLDDVLGHVHELVYEALAVHLGEDAALVVVAQRAPHGLVVHVRLVLVQPPQPRHCLGVHQLEHALLAVGPLNKARAILAVLQQLQQEFPEVRGGALAALALDAGRGGRVGARPLLGLELVVVVMPLVVAEVEHRVGQLVVREGRRRRSREVVRAAAAAAAVPVAVRVALAHAHCNQHKQTVTFGIRSRHNSYNLLRQQVPRMLLYI